MIRAFPAPQPPSPVQKSSWFPRQSLHFSPHLPMSRPKHGSKMACTERDETKALGDAPQVPISSHPRFRRIVTRHQISDQSPLLALPCDVRSGKWSMRRGLRHEVRGEDKRDPIPRFLEELKKLFSCEILRVSAPGRGRLLSRESAFSRSVRTEARLRTDCNCDVQREQKYYWPVIVLKLGSCWNVSLIEICSWNWQSWQRSDFIIEQFWMEKLRDFLNTWKLESNFSEISSPAK